MLGTSTPHNQAHRWQDRIKNLRLDSGVLLPTIILAAVGLVMVGSASVAVTESNHVDQYYYLLRHTIFLGGGIALATICRYTPLKWLETISRALLLVMVLLLLLPMLPVVGVEVNGSQRWINLGISRFQVVEAVKLMLVVYLAGYLAHRSGQLNKRFFDTIKPLALTGVLAVILLMQPDLGSAIVLVAIALGMLFLAGAAWRYLLILGGAVVPLFGVAAMEPYRLQRITSFLDPWADPFDSGFQLTQALIAIGRGEFFGVGLGASVQKLFYLPEAHTDFIFAVLAEEFGLLGIFILMLIYALLITRILQIGAQAHKLDRAFSGFMCWGIGLWLAMQAIISMGVNLGVLPTKGLTLPLISSGGSSLLMTCAAIGLVVRAKLEIDRELLARPQIKRDWSVGALA